MKTEMNRAMQCSHNRYADLTDLPISVANRAFHMLLMLIWVLALALPNYALDLEITDGGLDSSFVTGTGPNGKVYGAALQADGKILIGGAFTEVNGTARNFIARLEADGSLDTSFNPGANEVIYSIAVQKDGKILVGGFFTELSGTARNYIARLEADGSLDTSFDAGNFANETVHSVVVQSDGKILIGGNFFESGGVGKNGIARLNADGTLDTSFDPGSGGSNPGANGTVFSVVLQPDGKIIIGGSFTLINNSNRNFIARLESDGSLDTSFDPNANNHVYATVLQPDGKIIIGGNFTNAGGADITRIARLDIDGTLDTTFDPGTGPDRAVHSLALQADGQIYAAGEFTEFDGASQFAIARLYDDGFMDTIFSVDLDTGSEATSLALQSDGEIFIGGVFNVPAAEPFSTGIARLLSYTATQTLTVDTLARVEWLRGDSSPEINQVTFDLSTDGRSSWTGLGSGSRISGGWELTGLDLPVEGILRAQAYSVSGLNGGSSGLMEEQTSFSIFTLTAGTSPAAPGTSVTIPLNLNSAGTVSGVSFTLSYDAERFTNPVIAKTTVSNSATLLPNNSSSGVVEVALAFADGSAFTNGDQEILTLTLDIDPFAPSGTYPIGIGSSPTVFEMVDAGSNVLDSYSTDGAVLVNNPPVATADSESTDEDTPATFDVLANDSDVDEDTLTVTITSGPTNGTAAVQVDETVLYTPTADFHGSDSFTYTVNDGLVDSNEVSVTITVNSIDDPADLTPLSFSVNEDVTLVDTVTATDTDELTNNAVYSIFSQPANGSVSIGATTGEFTYIPDANFSDADTFDVRVTDDDSYTADFTITVNVQPIPDDPTAVDDAFSTNEHETLTILFTELTGNDFDVDGGTFTVNTAASDTASFRSAPVTVVNGNSFLYDPTEVQFIRDLQLGQSLIDTFSYTIEDPTGRTDSGTVSITVNGFNHTPVATADSESTDEDTEAFFDVLANDSDDDSDALTVDIVTHPSSGTAVVQGNETVLYTPNANFHGSDSFTYTINDGLVDSNEVTVDIIVNSVDDPASLDTVTFSVNEDVTLVDTVTATDLDGLTNMAVYSIFSQPTNGSVSIGDVSGEFTYIPDADFSDADTFEIRVTDDDSYTADFTITVNVQPLPDDPTAVDDDFETDEDQTLTILFTELLGNDFDVDGGTVTVNAGSSDTSSSNSAPITVVNGNSFLYDPTEVQSFIELEPGDTGSDTFSYTIEDPTGRTTSGTVTITLNGVGYEGDLTGLEFGSVTYEDNILDITDFVQAGRYLIHLDFLDENGRLFSSADTWPADTGGDGIIGLSDWIQTARYVAGLDSPATKFGPTIGNGGAFANQPATEDIFSGAAGISSLNADSNEDSKAAVELLISGDNFEAGKTGVVTLGVDSTGNFSSMGTTIEFDPALMTYVKSSLVDELAGSLTFIINDRKADQGLIGILIASNPGKTLPAGYLEVLKIEFNLSVDHSSGPLEISLNDKVLRSVISNRNAQKLEFTSQNTTANVQSITTFSQWAAIHETRSLNENGETLVLAENEDSDGDGLSNAVEFVLGTDPVKKNENPVRTSFKQVAGQTVFEAATEVITERGDIEVEIIPLNGDFMETGATGSGTSLFETRFGREKRIFQFPVDQQSGFFIIRIKNKNP